MLFGIISNSCKLFVNQNGLVFIIMHQKLPLVAGTESLKKKIVN